MPSLASSRMIMTVPVVSGATGMRIAPQPAVRPAVMTRFNPALLNLIVAVPAQPAHENLPDASKQTGSVFADRYDPAIAWYLPGYALTDDPDAAFGYAASQSGVDSSGNPFHTATLTLGLSKAVPQDVADYRKANPGIDVREIPLHNLSAILSVAYKDSTTGADQRTSFVGAIDAHADGSAIVTFSSIVGSSVVILYENLKSTYEAHLTLSAAYDVWKLKAAPRFMPWFLAARAAGPAGAVAFRPAVFAPVVDTQPPAGAPPADPYERDSLFFSAAIPLDQKYAGDAYQLRYTVAAGSGPRPIVSSDDLRDFNVVQSEFTELKVLGDVGSRYPTLRALYIGTLSKTIVIIPREYVIARKTSACAATCLALVDSSSAGPASCKFEFSFLLTPNLSAIDVMQLSQEVSARVDLAGYLLKLPDTLSVKFPSSIAGGFPTSCQFSGAANQHSFTLTVDVRDEGVGTPAVANANLFIAQLCLGREPFLTGTLNLKLDDDYASPVEATIVLDLQHTNGTEGIEPDVDEADQRIDLVNKSPFDFAIARYALCTSQGAAVVASDATLGAGQTTSVPLPAEHDGLSILLEYAPVAAGDIARGALAQYMQFQTQDVQNVQYLLGVNASGVNFDGRNVDKVAVSVALTDLPQVSVPQFALFGLDTLSSTQIQIPVQYAVSSLKAELQFTVHFKDPNAAVVQFTKPNDFIQTPIFVLLDADLAVAVPA